MRVDSGLPLIEHLESQPELCAYTINIPQKGMKDCKGNPINRVTRRAKLTVKVATVSLKT